VGVPPPAQTLARPVGGEIRPPTYPPDAARRREQGRVLVRVEVAADGTPTTASVAQGSGSPRLDEAALAAVRRSRFVPAMRIGQPVPGTAEVPIVFRLE
jgi:periplasmic protein TonB